MTDLSVTSAAPLFRVRRRHRGLSAQRIGLYGFLFCAALFFSIPLLIMISTSLKTAEEVR